MQLHDSGPRSAYIWRHQFARLSYREAFDTRVQSSYTRTRNQLGGDSCVARHNSIQKVDMNNGHHNESELASLIVESLNLQETSPETIDPEARLFGEGLGLDSLDMLELSMAVEQKYGVKLRSDDPENKSIFGSLRSLSQHIQLHRTA